MLCLLIQLCLGFNARAQMNMNRMNRMNKSDLHPGISDRLLALAYIHKLDEQAVQELLLPLKRAEGQEFPVHTLLMKIEEGLSKKIAVKRIVATLNIMIKRFERFDLILKRLPPHVRMHRKRALKLMNGLVAMGIKSEEIEAHLTMSEGLAPVQVFKALETKVALTNTGLAAEDADRIVKKGLESGFFQRPGCWNLAHVAYAAGKLGIETNRIYEMSMQVVSGKKNLHDAVKELGLRHKGPGFCRSRFDTQRGYHKE